MAPYSSEDHALSSESERIAALHSLQILDTAPEKSFDDLARLASAICGTPIAFVNLLDRDRQWFKARVGIARTELPRAQSFCNHLVGQQNPMIISDATTDVRFCDSPFVLGEPKMRFYAGVPLNTAEGHTLGTLCVADVEPHLLTAGQTEALVTLGHQVTALLELRAQVQRFQVVLREKERVERELREQALLFSAFMDHSPTIAFIKDRQGRFRFYNRTFCERFAVSSTEWIGKNVFDLFPEAFASAYHDLDMAVLHSGVSQVVDETSPGPDGTTLYWRTHKFRIGDDGISGLLGGLSLDISAEKEAVARLRCSHTQLEAANRQLVKLSVTDGLTGLLNRRAFDDRLASKMNASTVLSLLLLDVDHFKSLNDVYGHPAGDSVLRTVADLLERNSRGSDCVARYGGEEFAILLCGSGEQEAMEVADRLRTAVEEFPWERRSVTLSAGVATCGATIRTAAELLSAADVALYRAKHRGRNCVVAA